MEIKLRKRKFDLFLCFDCKQVTAYSEGTGDGLRCPACSSPLNVYLGTYEYSHREDKHV